MWETWVPPLGWEDLLEEEMVTHSGILAWKIPWAEELGGLVHGGHKSLDTTEQLNTYTEGGNGGKKLKESHGGYVGSFFPMLETHAVAQITFCLCPCQ